MNKFNTLSVVQNSVQVTV